MEQKEIPMAERKIPCSICKEVTKRKDMGIIPKRIDDCDEYEAPHFQIGIDAGKPFQFSVCFPCASDRGYTNPPKMIGDFYREEIVA